MNNSRSSEICCSDERGITIYSSIKECAEDTGFSYKHICKSIKEKKEVELKKGLKKGKRPYFRKLIFRSERGKRMFAEKDKLEIERMLSIVVGLVATIVGRKALAFSVGSYQILLPGSAFYFVVSYVLINQISAQFGEAEGKKTVVLGIVMQILAVVLFGFVNLLPAQDVDVGSAYSEILGTNWAFVAGNVSAMLVAQFLQLKLFSLLKDFSLTLANLLSIAAAQLVDTFIFVFVAFGLGCGWLFAKSCQIELINMVLSQTGVKLLIVFFLVPASLKLMLELSKAQTLDKDRSS